MLAAGLFELMVFINRMKLALEIRKLRSILDEKGLV